MARLSRPPAEVRDTETETRGGEHGFSRWSLPSLRHRRHSCRTSAQSRTASHQCPASTQGDHTLDHTLQPPHILHTTQHSTAQHSTAQHSTAQHSTAQHSTIQHSRYGLKYIKKYLNANTFQNYFVYFSNSLDILVSMHNRINEDRLAT